MSPPEPGRYPLLGLVAYALVPGERRVRAARHFRRAGVEVLRGAAAFITPEKVAGDEATERKRIELD